MSSSAAVATSSGPLAPQDASVAAPPATDHDATAVKSPEFVKRMTDLGYLIIPGTADQMTDMIKAEIVRWTPVVKSSGAKID